MKSELEKFIANNAADMDRRIPDPMVLNRILQQMEVKTATRQPAGIVIPFRILRWAAAALVLVACGIVIYSLQFSKKQADIAIYKPATKTATSLPNEIMAKPNTEQPDTAIAATGKSLDEVDRDIAGRKKALLAQFNTNNQSRKLVMLTSLQDMDSPARRINAVSQSVEFKMAGRDIVTALLSTLNNDPNTNVRLAALDGLARFYRETYIRKQLIASLKTQQNPTVQIALIELLTRMKEAAVLAELDKIVANDSTMTAVKDCAYSGIFKLRKSS